MALQKSINYKGITVNDCYIRVTRIDGNKTEVSFGLAYSANANAEAFNNETHACSYDVNGENPIKQAYEYLKTLPEFADATDV